MHNQKSEWDYARKTFPRTKFPWDEVFESEKLKTVLRQLSKSCATTSGSIPGTVFTIVASIVGNLVKIRVKDNWEEFIIIWNIDIRESGTAKTPMSQSLCKPIFDKQARAEKIYAEKIKKELKKKKKDRLVVEPVRVFFMTDFTVEGLYVCSPEKGGILFVADELSSFVTAQNQYRGGKCSDRESYTSLWSGIPIKVVRKGKGVFVDSSCVSVTGGTQPETWEKIFGSQGGIFLTDGTIFRFTITIEDEEEISLTKEGWGEDNRLFWEKLINNIIKWPEENELTIFDLDNEALDFFINWREKLYKERKKFPRELRGVVPKIAAYAIRLAGDAHFINRFSQSLEFNSKLDLGLKIDLAAIKRGIKAAEYYWDML